MARSCIGTPTSTRSPRTSRLTAPATQGATARPWVKRRSTRGIAVAVTCGMTRISSVVLLAVFVTACDGSNATSPTAPTVVVSRLTFTSTPSPTPTPTATVPTVATTTPTVGTMPTPVPAPPASTVGTTPSLINVPPPSQPPGTTLPPPTNPVPTPPASTGGAPVGTGTSTIITVTPAPKP